MDVGQEWTDREKIITAEAGENPTCVLAGRDTDCSHLARLDHNQAGFSARTEGAKEAVAIW
jgi:hypothetical protein